MTAQVTEHATQTHAGPEECCAGAECDMLPRELAEDLADVVKALPDPTRVRLLQYLAETDSGTTCACHLPAALGISQPTLSFHMRKLYDAGLVERDRRGRWVHYTIRFETLDRVRSFLALPARRGRDNSC